MEIGSMLPDSVGIEKRIADFKADLKLLRPVDIVRRHIISGPCYVMNDTAYYELKTKVADQYKLHTNELCVVGSGKLGFSIAPKKQYQHFSETSDVDVVVVSAKLFDMFWKKVHYYVEHGGYWEQLADFKKYHFHGWIRPDKFPPEKSFDEAQKWWTFFNELSSTGRYSTFKVRGAIYRDWDFLESYQLLSVTACKEKV